MNYEEAIQSEIKKRKTNAIIEKIEKMTDEELYSEAKRIKAPKPDIIRSEILEEHIVECEEEIIKIKKEIKEINRCLTDQENDIRKLECRYLEMYKSTEGIPETKVIAWLAFLMGFVIGMYLIWF